MFSMDGGTDVDKGQGKSFRRQAWAEWTDAALISAWLKWADRAAAHQSSLTAILTQPLASLTGKRVLDLASGLGEPAFTLAQAVGPSGHVAAVEISVDFVQAMAAKARTLGLSNLDVVQAEACELPFPDNSFDITTSRLGPMYFVPIAQAMAEVRRVLVPGGQVAFMTWGMPEQGSFFASCLFPFVARSEIQPPPADAPTPFRFSPPGRLANELRSAGFAEIQEIRQLATLAWPGTPDELWTFLYETASSFRSVFDSLDRTTFDEAKGEALSLLARNYRDGTTMTTAEVVVGIGIAQK